MSELGEVCSRCDGSGTHPMAVSPEDWEDWPFEAQERYLNGYYDVTCEECDGDSGDQP